MNYLTDRLKEASSAAGFASILTGAGLMSGGQFWLGLGTICGGIAAILVPGGRAA